jgi:site-specific recombinase XerD
MLEDLQIRHYSPTTIRLYLYAVRAFAKHFGKPPDQLGAEHIRRYQLFLTKEKKVSTSTYVMMICGLRFFYTHTLHRKVAIDRIPFPRHERKLPVILSREEVKALLEAPSDLRDRAMLAILYGAGLRVSEVPALKSPTSTVPAMCCGFVSAKGGKTGKRCCRRSCANCCAATGDPRSPPIGYFPARVRANPSR